MGGNENYIQTFSARNQSIDDELSSLESLSKSSDLQKHDQPSPSSGSKTGRKTLPHEAKVWGSTDRISTQSDTERHYVQSHYKAEDLFRVVKDYKSYETMDLPVFEGQLLGVIMRKDPMGHEEKWFVDSGSAKGFVSKSILAPLAASGIQAPPSYSAVVSSDAAQYPEMRYVGSHLYPKFSSKTESSEPEALKSASAKQPKPVGYATSEQPLTADVESTSDESSSHNQSYSSLPEEERFFCYALYPFEPLGENQLKIFERQVLQVLQRHDEDENVEWWLVRSETGDEGYVPANYVKEFVPGD